MDTVKYSRLEHREAFTIISRIERKLKRRTREIQERRNIKYTDALSVTCMELGLKNHYSFRQLMISLRARAEHFSTQEQRIRCAESEVPDSQAHYYLFNAHLGLRTDLPDDQSSIDTRSISTLCSSWVGWPEDDPEFELRVASFVDPERALQRFRVKAEKTVYVINNEADVFLWMLAWGGIALITAELVQSTDFLAKFLIPFKCKQGTM